MWKHVKFKLSKEYWPIGSVSDLQFSMNKCILFLEAGFDKGVVVATEYEISWEELKMEQAGKLKAGCFPYSLFSKCDLQTSSSSISWDVRNADSQALPRVRNSGGAQESIILIAHLN